MTSNMGSDNTIQNLEEELLAMQADEEMLDATKPQHLGFAKALEKKKKLLEKVKNF